MSKKTLIISIISALVIVLIGGFLITAPTRHHLNQQLNQATTHLNNIHKAVNNQHKQIPNLIKNSSSDKDDQAAVKMTISKNEKTYHKQMNIYDRKDSTLSDKLQALQKAQSASNNSINLITERYHLSLINDSTSQLDSLHKNYNTINKNRKDFNNTIQKYQNVKKTFFGSFVSGLRPNKYVQLSEYKTVQPQLLLPFVLSNNMNDLIQQPTN